MPFCNDTFYRVYDGEPNNFTYPVILLHGSGGNHMAWPLEMRRVRGQRVFSLDLPGHGQSTNPASLSVLSIVKSLRQFIQDMNFFKVVLIGHSLGGILAIQYAARYPESVKGLMVLACGSQFSIPASLWNNLQNSNGKSQFIEQFSQLSFQPDFPQSQRNKILEPLKKMRLSLLTADLTICSKFNAQKDLSPIELPVSIIGGAGDQITPPGTVRQLSQYLSNSTVKIMRKCGHMLIYEKTTQISQLMRDFLNTCVWP